jgi:hypothetical protein
VTPPAVTLVSWLSSSRTYVSVPAAEVIEVRLPFSSREYV